MSYCDRRDGLALTCAQDQTGARAETPNVVRLGQERWVGVVVGMRQAVTAQTCREDVHCFRYAPRAVPTAK